MPDTLTAVDVIVPLRNEEARIPEFLAMLQAQTLRPRRVIIADGMSTDGSRELLDIARRQFPELTVVDNPRRNVPSALNTCLAHATSPIVARMDTHANYHPDYLSSVVQVLDDHPDVDGAGGAMETAGRGPWGRAIASTLRRRFGLGGARHRVGGDPGPISHVFSGCYRTSALRAIGGWDERLLANEDFEADTRIRSRGGVLWLAPEARSTWFVRESPRKLAVQMWRYGYYKALTLRLHPHSLQRRQLAPPGLVVGLLTGALLRPRATSYAAGAYVATAGALGAVSAHRDGHSALRGAFIPPIVHLGWGAGLVTGLLRFGGSTPSPRSKEVWDVDESHR